MNVDVKLKYSLNEILTEFDYNVSDDIIPLKANDKFFVGRGCEAPYSEDMPEEFIKNKQFLKKAYHDSQKHFSICTDNTIVL
ncbi:hypothetical protein [Sulfurimonas sp.]